MSNAPSRRAVLHTLAAGAGMGRIAGAAGYTRQEPKPHRLAAFVGTYTEGTQSRGIYRFEFDAESGGLSMPVAVGEAANPSFLALHPTQRLLFAVNEVSKIDDHKGGAVSAFSVGSDGALKPVDRMPSQGSAPCHLSVDPSGTIILVANYVSGSLGALGIGDDGSLAPLGVAFQAEGKGPNAQRQEGPHAHCVRFDPSGRFAVEADLGIDRVHVFRFEADSAKSKAPLKPVQTIELKPGAGPRHLAFHPNGRFLFVNGELDSSLNVFRFDPETGAAQAIGSLSTLPEGGHAGNTTAETVVHPSGRMVFVSNRGHDSIARFAFDPETGVLRALGQTPTRGQTPRNFTLDPAGRWLFVANQGSNSITVFRVDRESSDLEPIGAPVGVPAPVCILFDPPRG